DAIKIKMGSGVVGAMSEWVAANVEAIKIAGSLSEAMRLFVFNMDAVTSEKPAAEIRRLTTELEKFQKASAGERFLQAPFGQSAANFEGDIKKKIEFVKYLQRAQALALTAGMDTSDQVSRGAGSVKKNKAPALPDFAAIKAAAAEQKKVVDKYNKM
ncbi:MAG: hypothetical protein ACTS5I_14740, partial [Rhodanobacter sp.]